MAEREDALAIGADFFTVFAGVAKAGGRHLHPVYKEFVTTFSRTGFDMIGIAARASNRDVSTIAEIWRGFMGNDAPSRIPNRADDRLIALYSDYEYENDEHWAFTMTIGARVAHTSEVPEGMVLAHAPTGQYAQFTCEKGDPAQVVPAAWQRIWKEPETPAFTRTYRADYEVYGGERIEIFVGVTE